MTRSETVPVALRLRQRVLKRGFDLLFSGAVVVGLSPVMVVAVLAATVDTGQWGVFTQVRVGRGGRVFKVYKIRSMRPAAPGATTVTVSHDPRITPLGRWLRALKLDELPQFVNVLLGQMSVVGPRPDVPGYADALEGDDRVLLSVRPGITGPAAVYYRDEEGLLAAQHDPERFNDEVLWPSKVRINRDYLENYSFAEDLRLILDTAVSRLRLSRAARARVGELDDPVFGQVAPQPYRAEGHSS